MIIVGIAGGSGSGKTTFAEALQRNLNSNSVIISQDSYYVDQPGVPLEKRVLMNYDHPAAFENKLLLSHLEALREGESVKVPTYDFSNYCRSEKTILVHPRPVVIVEGILILENEELRNALDIKVYVDTDPDIRVLRRLMRDVNERNRTVEAVYEQYLATVKPMHEAYVEPSKKYADILVPEGGLNMVALSLVTSRLKGYVTEMSRIGK